MKVPISQYDVVFISYDEDNADKHWADLLNKVPWAKRVHGVEGSDASHKAAGREATTDRVITVDADNIVDEDFFDQSFDFEHPKFKDKVISWAAINDINGLQYGNGGLKCWPREYILEMQTHENAKDKESQIEFCWNDSYVQMNNIYCTTYPNGSARQAWRAGFREGVKMSLDRGNRVPPNSFKDRIWWGNYQRLLTWCSVGADVENGLWAMYGARLGCYKTTLTDWDYINVRDFTYLNEMWNSECKGVNLEYEIQKLGKTLRKDINLPIAELDALGSKFYKASHSATPRTGSYMTEEELIALREINA